ncbi:NUDIX hydrolase [Pauljensenia hongkongensis]|uniref:NUDIX hydrolase n=1 Tax=Pauljensenia hongkongensis TaxID=178339 RepID=A0A1D8B1Y4_9ACTO|nr:NUDIX domain-containing protein [Pauljensenia hongkongensis]AOS47134.1 NUDIX hydrolase [Pauljensenia hongkongensis]EFW10197.1 MutT/nudix family DNA hydrolase [Actinomyces sp. oral taxon 178 str. F0338]
MITPLAFPIAVDVVALTVIDRALHCLVVTRGIDPYRGRPALPGGFVRENEQTLQAAERELEEETGITPPGHLEQLRSYGPQGRDPRGPVLSVAHLLLAPRFSPARPGGDAAGAHWRPVDALLAPGSPLAFDHAAILADGVERARSKIEYSPLATSFCGPEFTITQLRTAYEAIWGAPLDPRNFHRKATKTASFIEATGRTAREGAGRPAALYRLTPGVDETAFVLDPPLRRPAGPAPAPPTTAPPPPIARQ